MLFHSSLFQSALKRDVAKVFGGTLLVLVTIVMTMMLIRTLGQASKGSVNPQEIMLIMTYAVLGHMPTVLSLSLFIALVSALSRMFKDSEMVIWHSSGLGLLAFLRPLLTFATPVIVVIFIMALWVWPWSNQQTQLMKDRFEQRGDVERIAPGQFQESANGLRVFYIDQATAANQSVFIAATERGKQSVTTAQSGLIQPVDNARHLLLNNGQRLERELVKGTFKVSQFEVLGSRVEEDKPLIASVPPNTQSVHDLIKGVKPEQKSELAWRIGLGLAALNFVLIGLAVSNVNPRVGRGGNLLFALFTFIVYYNMINVSKSWIESQQSNLMEVLFKVHGTVFLAALMWLVVKHLQWDLKIPALKLPRLKS